MGDRELLEKAAKAAGFPIGQAEGEWSYRERGFDGPGLYENNIGRGLFWNPLTDDGDNRRLQVALRLGLIPLEGGGWDVTHYDSESCEERMIATDSDPNRAIVRAAAALEEPHHAG